MWNEAARRLSPCPVNQSVISNRDNTQHPKIPNSRSYGLVLFFCLIMQFFWICLSVKTSWIQIEEWEIILSCYSHYGNLGKTNSHPNGNKVSFMYLIHHKLNHRNYFSNWNHKILPHDNIYIILQILKTVGSTQRQAPLPRCRVDLTRWYTSLWLGSMCPLRFSDMLCRPNPSRLNSPRGLVGDLYTCINQSFNCKCITLGKIFIFSAYSSWYISLHKIR